MAYGASGGIDSGPKRMLAPVRAPTIDPLKPLPPICASFWFQATGRSTWKLIGGAAGSTGAIAPRTWQYSGVGSWTVVPVTIGAGIAATVVVAVTVAPRVGE